LEMNAIKLVDVRRQRDRGRRDWAPLGVSAASLSHFKLYRRSISGRSNRTLAAGALSHSFAELDL
jgi:hypothetical protein